MSAFNVASALLSVIYEQVLQVPELDKNNHSSPKEVFFGTSRSIREVLIWGATQLARTSESARLDAELLLGDLLGLERHELIRDALEPVGAENCRNFAAYIERRISSEPLAYIIKRKEFYGLQFEVNRDVLIPRPETEELVERVIQQALKLDTTVRILDLGTGSGCIAIAIARSLLEHLRDFRIVGVDRSNAALAVAKRNAERWCGGCAFELRKSNWFSALRAGMDRFDIIVSNPPYIAENDLEVSPELRFEPHDALYSGPDGTRDLKILFQQVPDYLSERGMFFCEIGWQQRRLVETMVREMTGEFGLQFYKDLSGHDRIVMLSRTEVS